jgi:hypothetical protein
MPADEARTFLEQLQQKIASSETEVQHRDVLIGYGLRRTSHRAQRLSLSGQAEDGDSDRHAA